MSKKIIKEVGEGSSPSFPYRREKNTSTLGLNLERHEFDFRFQTDEGYIYSVVIERAIGWAAESEDEIDSDVQFFFQSDREALEKLISMGVTRETITDLWMCNFNIEDHVRIKNPYALEPIQSYSHTPNKGEFFKVMSTIVKIVTETMGRVGGKVLLFTPEDERRGRIFTQYIKKQKPNVKYFKEDKTLYLVF